MNLPYPSFCKPSQIYFCVGCEVRSSPIIFHMEMQLFHMPFSESESVENLPVPPSPPLPSPPLHSRSLTWEVGDRTAALCGNP